METAFSETEVQVDPPPPPAQLPRGLDPQQDPPARPPVTTRRRYGLFLRFGTRWGWRGEFRTTVPALASHRDAEPEPPHLDSPANVQVRTEMCEGHRGVKRQVQDGFCWFCSPQAWRLPYIKGMMKTEMSSPEPRRSLVIRHPRSRSTPRARITRSCAAIVYLRDTGSVSASPAWGGRETTHL